MHLTCTCRYHLYYFAECTYMYMYCTCEHCIIILLGNQHKAPEDDCAVGGEVPLQAAAVGGNRNRTTTGWWRRSNYKHAYNQIRVRACVVSSMNCHGHRRFCWFSYCEHCYIVSTYSMCCTSTWAIHICMHSTIKIYMCVTWLILYSKI